MKALTQAVAALAFTLMIGGCVMQPGAPVFTTAAPPLFAAEYVGVAPGPGYFWVSGVWLWEAGGYVWHVGRWMASRPGFRWVPHQWVAVPGGWELHGGHWQREV